MPVREPGASAPEEPRAPYVSMVRDQSARATRRSIVVAATGLFVGQGYAATTIDAIAERAGVGRKTVFSSVGGKGALLKLAWDWALVGDDEPIPMSERAAVQAMLAERDPVRLVRMWVDMVLDVGTRATPIAMVVLAAADVDDEARALLGVIRRESLTGATAFVGHLAAVGGLRGDVTIEQGADACFALVNSMLQHLLVTTRDWSLQAFGDWLVSLASTSLLEPAGPAGGRDAEPVQVRDNTSRNRYEATVRGSPVGHLSYERTERLLVLLHTEVEPAIDDRGIADALASRAFSDLPSDGTRLVVPVCPYVTWWLSRHRDLASLVHQRGSHT